MVSRPNISSKYFGALYSQIFRQKISDTRNQIINSKDFSIIKKGQETGVIEEVEDRIHLMIINREVKFYQICQWEGEAVEVADYSP